jgi:large subunit ribosomal protein L4
MENKKVLFVIPEANENLMLSSRNLKKVRIARARDLNTYEILDAACLLVTENSVREIEKSYLQESVNPNNP